MESSTANPPFFSVIVPLYNKEKHIAETLQSVEKQSFQDLEIVVVDDGSTDGGLTIARNLHLNRTRIFTQKNQGSAAARNHGAQEARGQFFCFLDADDIWENNFLQAIYDLIQTFPEAGLFATHYVLDFGDSQREPKTWGIPKNQDKMVVPNYFESTLQGEPLFPTSACCIPRTVFEKCGGFDQSIRYTEDQELFNRIAMRWPVAFYQKKSVRFNQVATNRKTARIPKHEIEFAAKLQEQIEDGEVPKKWLGDCRKIVAANLIGAAATNLLAGDKKTARRFLSDSRTQLLPKKRNLWSNLSLLPTPLLKRLYNFYKP